MMLVDILDLPNSRSLDVMGISLTLNPDVQDANFISIWKEYPTNRILSRSRVFSTLLWYPTKPAVTSCTGSLVIKRTYIEAILLSHNRLRGQFTTPPPGTYRLPTTTSVRFSVSSSTIRTRSMGLWEKSASISYTK